MGGVQALRDLTASGIGSLEFMDASTAQARLSRHRLERHFGSDRSTLSDRTLTAALWTLGTLVLAALAVIVVVGCEQRESRCGPPPLAALVSIGSSSPKSLLSTGHCSTTRPIL